MNACQLVLPAVAKLTPYVPGKPISELERELGITHIHKLASNENPLGPSPLALAAVRNVLETLNLYPDGSGFDLKNALADKLGVVTQQLTLGNGSNDVLELIARAFLSSDYAAVFSEHAFAVYSIVTQAVGAEARVAKARGYGHDLESMLALVDEKVRMIFIANPNNPTGTWLRRSELENFLVRLPDSVLVVIDEAYFEYVSEPDYPDALQWLDKYPNLLVTRTFSKAYGLAGLRVGYAVSHPEIADYLNRVRQPFNVNSLALVAAVAALQDSDHLRKTVQTNTAGMMQLSQAFVARSLDFIASVGNFITVDVGSAASSVYDTLLRAGVIVRPVANYGLPKHLRVSIGTEEQNNAFLNALDRVLA